MPRETYVLKRLPSGEHELVTRAELSAWINKHYPDKMKCTIPRKFTRGSWIWDGEKLVEKSQYRNTRNQSKLQIIKDIEPFQNIAVDNGVIGGRKQRRDMMRAYGLTEVGNEKPMEHPRDIADRKRDRPDRSIVESLKRHSGGKWL
ncbi:hypothetical protein UFOVP1169_14 [uncultured Caudovirales phage]|uniref:Uncharacterized protein n=1 Tax=uncultured Caudovirales phage TaxID=2100421 RepID=A0A6J5R2R5_9CAUD|nr:hypothetical protein UFOVP1169_14 [uncultured Caudovirales phage]